MIDWNDPAPEGYRRNARGDLVHDSNIKAVDLDMDETTRKIHGFAARLSAQMYRFREHTLEDIDAFVDRCLERYSAQVGGRKGNIQITTFDGLLQCRLSRSDVLNVGPEIEAARSLIDECVSDWGEGSHVNLRALIAQAFRPNEGGQISVTEVLRLRRIEIDDDRWRRAQLAIGDALRPAGKAEYVRIYQRATPLDPWQPVPLHLATVTRPPDEPEDLAANDSLSHRLRSAIDDARLAGVKEGVIWRVMLAAKRPVGPVADAREPGTDE